jgi:ferric-dicitrate binding protein FerR (iron transport regulator)
MKGESNMYDERMPAGQDDGDLARLLAATGPRKQPSDRATIEVRSAVEAEWRRSVTARQARRRYTSWAAAAGVAAAAVAVWMARPLYLPGAEPVASLARVVGDAQMDAGDGRWTPLAAGSVVKAGAVIRTGSSGRAAITMKQGVELRLDSDTQLAFNDASEATMSQGAVYVDSGPEAGATAGNFMLDTPVGTVRHVGTQYEARLVDGELRVGIREGRVEVTHAHESVLGSAGEVLTVSGGGAARSRLSPTSADWQWVNGVTPPFSIEGRSVKEFLAWAARETGRKVVYSSPVAERQAGSVTLRGTVEGLAPDRAVTAVLATTSLRPSVEDEQITIDTAAD